MKNSNWKNNLLKGGILLFCLALGLTSCSKRSYQSDVLHSLLTRKDTTIINKDTIITLDTIINKLDTTIIDTNFHDLLTFQVTYQGGDLPSDLSVNDGSNDLDFSIESEGKDWEYFKATSVDWLSETEKTDNSLKLKVSENKGAERSAYILFSLKDYPAKFALVKITQAEVGVPKAGLLDVVFNSDGTAKDVSPMNMTVTNVENDHPYSITHNSTFNLDVANFDPGDANIGTSLGVGNGSYFRIDYDANQEFKDKLADGFSIEALVKVNHDNFSTPIAYEVGMFGTIWGGGVSLMMRTAGGGYNNLSMEINTEGYHYTQAFTPQPDVWYHLVGVWDGGSGQAKLYIDGALMSYADLSGKSYTHVNDALVRWFAIGGTPGKNELRSAFKGSVGIARIYDNPLSAEEVKALWSRVNK